jgi:REP element-mobilizing transposase RayT
MTNYRRYRLKGGCYFFTVALAERRGRLLTENIQGLRNAFREVKQAHLFTAPTHVLYCNLLINIAARQELVRQNISSFYNSLKI